LLIVRAKDYTTEPLYWLQLVRITISLPFLMTQQVYKISYIIVMGGEIVKGWVALKQLFGFELTHTVLYYYIKNSE
jgi:hypothetical protein